MSLLWSYCSRSFLAPIFLAMLFIPYAEAQQLLQVLEPGIGYARFKQWAVESQLLFENFTKDSLWFVTQD